MIRPHLNPLSAPPGRDPEEADSAAGEGLPRLFSSLTLYQDIDSRSGALNMAIDETLLEIASAPTIRFYRWNHPALSFGYFGKFDDVADQKDEREIVRRWTGGGIVFHGEDLTYSIVIPANDPVFANFSKAIYEKTHTAICMALVANGQRAELAGPSTFNIDSRSPDRSVASPGDQCSPSDGFPARRIQPSTFNAPCFANPVRSDVLLNGRKVAGAAQRRTRRGLLQQGSIQNVDLGERFGCRFASELSNNWKVERVSDALLARAQAIAGKKYLTPAWLGRR